MARRNTRKFNTPMCYISLPPLVFPFTQGRYGGTGKKSVVSQIQSSIKHSGQYLIRKMKEQSVNTVIEIVMMERLKDYTCNPDYMTFWTQKTGEQESFINAVQKNANKPEYSLTGFGNVKISHLRKYHAHLLQQAFHMKMRISSYWTIVLWRIVDNLALHLQFTVRNLVNKEVQKEVVAEMVDSKSGSGGGVHRLLIAGRITVHSELEREAE